MPFDWWTLALQTINFVILAWLLHRFLYRPVLRLVDGRRADIEKEYDEAGKVQAEAQAERAAIEREHAGIAAERETILNAAAVQAEEAAAQRRQRAERDASALIDEARKTLSAEREEALAGIRRLALDLGAEMARRLLAEVPAKLRAEAWLERIEAHLGKLPESEIACLRGEFDSAGPLTVVTASPLPPDAAADWRARLGRVFGEGIKIAFEADAKLVAGAELHFPNAVLRFSWQSALAALREGVEADGSAG